MSVERTYGENDAHNDAVDEVADIIDEHGADVDEVRAAGAGEIALKRFSGKVDVRTRVTQPLLEAGYVIDAVSEQGNVWLKPLVIEEREVTRTETVPTYKRAVDVEW